MYPVRHDGATAKGDNRWVDEGFFLFPLLNRVEFVAELILQVGGESLDQLFETTCYKLGKYLQEIGLVKKEINDYKELAGQGYKFCPHHVSHYLGMDVHDTPHVPRHTRIQPGMVFTVEPGIYIDEKRTDVPPEFRGIGIRIEDDILINEQGQVEVLTASCVKERRALEKLCGQK